MEALIFLKQVTGFYYYINPEKPFRKFRMGEAHQGARKCLESNQWQKISILKYRMLSQKTVDLLRKKLQAFQKIRNSTHVPNSIMKYYCHFFNIGQSNLYIITQFFPKSIPFQLKVIHPVQLMTVVSRQILQAFIYLQSIELYSPSFTIYINQKLEIKIADFGFEYEINSFNYQYQSDSNLCVDWPWGYIPGEKHRQIYDQYVQENFLQLTDQKLKKQKSQKLYTWLYGLIIYNKLCSTMLANQKYKMRNSSGQYWYVWCCLLKCLFIREDIIDYSKGYKMVAADVLDVLKKFQYCPLQIDILENFMNQQVQGTQLAQKFSSQYFQFFTSIKQLPINEQFTETQVKSTWITTLVEVLKKYAFQPYSLRATVSEILKIIHGPSKSNILLREQMIKLYADTQFQLVKSLHKSEEIKREQTINYCYQQAQDPYFQEWYKRFMFSGEEYKKQNRQKLQKTRSQLFPLIKCLFYQKKEVKQKNAICFIRLSYIEISQQIFKGLCKKKKNKNNITDNKQYMEKWVKAAQLQQLKPIIKQLTLIQIYIQIVALLEEINYNRQNYQKQRNKIFSTHSYQEHKVQSQTQEQFVNLNNCIGNTFRKEQQQYNNQICVYVQIRHKLRIRLKQIQKILCEYNYAMVPYLSQLIGTQDKQQSIINFNTINQFFKKTTDLIVIKHIHQIVLANQIKHPNEQAYICQYREYVKQFNKIINIFSTKSYQIFVQTHEAVKQITKLNKNQYLMVEYYLKLLMLQLLGCVTTTRKLMQVKTINTHTSTFVCSFLRQKILKLDKQTMRKEQQDVKQDVNQDIKNIKYLIELLHTHVAVSIKNL